MFHYDGRCILPLYDMITKKAMEGGHVFVM